MNKETRNNEVSTGFSNEISSGISTGSEGTGVSIGNASLQKDKKSGLSKKQKTLAWIGGGILTAAAIGGAIGYGVHEGAENRSDISELGRSGGIHTIKAGERFEVPANSIINGDVMIEVNGKLQRLFDNDPNTGAQIITKVPLKGFAPIFEGNKGGATIETNINPTLINTIAEQDRVVTAEVTGIKAENIEVVKFPQGK